MVAERVMAVLLILAVAALLFAAAGCVSPCNPNPPQEYVCADGTVVNSSSQCPTPGEVTPTPQPTPAVTPTPQPTPTPSPSPAPTNRNFSAGIENAEMYAFVGIHSLYNRTFPGTVAVAGMDPTKEFLLVGTGYWENPSRTLYVLNAKNGSAVWNNSVTRCDADITVPGLILVYGCWAVNKSADMTAYNLSNGNMLWNVTLHNFDGTVYTWDDMGSGRGLETGYSIRSFMDVIDVFNDTGDQFVVNYQYYSPLRGTYVSILDTRSVKTGGLLGRKETPLSLDKSPGSFYFANGRYFHFDDYGGNELYYIQNWTGWGASRSLWNLTTTYPEVGENCTFWQTWPTSGGDMIYYRCTLNKTQPGHPAWNVDWTEKICATDITTGKMKWMWNGTGTVYYNFYSSTAPPFVKNGGVGFVADNSKLVMLNATDGSEIWTRAVDCLPYPLDGVKAEEELRHCVTKRPAAIGNYVIYPENSGITAFALAGGERKWHMNSTSPAGGLWYYEDVAVAWSNGTVYLLQVGE